VPARPPGGGRLWPLAGRLTPGRRRRRSPEIGRPGRRGLDHAGGGGPPSGRQAAAPPQRRVRCAPAGPRRDHHRAALPEGGRGAGRHAGRLAEGRGRREGDASHRRGREGDLRAEPGRGRHAHPRRAGPRHRALAARASPGRARGAVPGRAEGQDGRESDARRAPGCGDGPRRRSRPGPRRRARHDRRVPRLSVPVLPPGPGRRRRAPGPLRGQGPLRPPRLPARQAPLAARRPGRPLRRRAGQVLGVPPEPARQLRGHERRGPEEPGGGDGSGHREVLCLRGVRPLRRRHQAVHGIGQLAGHRRHADLLRQRPPSELGKPGG